MAIIINPDGTVSSIETTHDQYGNLKPKIDSDTAGTGNVKRVILHKSIVTEYDILHLVII